MSSSILIAVASALGAAPFPALGATVERVYSLVSDIQDLQSRRVVVLPADSLLSRQSRALSRATVGVQIAIQEKPANLAAQDAIVDLAEGIAAVLLEDNPVSGGKVLGDVIVIPILPEHFEEFGVHTAILNFTVAVP